jgi:hypothetical protein
MDAVHTILQAHGYESAADMPVGEPVRVELGGPAQMPLVIEKIGEDRLSVAHYYTQMGDLMSDPEIVFHIDNGEWTPVRYTQHPHIHQHDEDGLPDVAAFAADWSRNLKQQGYVEAAEGGA